MDTLSSRLFLPVVVLMPTLGWASTSVNSGLMSDHWDSVLLVAFGVLIVWHEVRSAMRSRSQAQKNNAWGALNSWQYSAPKQSGWLPVLAKQARRTRR